MNAHTNATVLGRSRPGRSARAGFTLVELLVAIALGLLVMIALIAVYTNVSRTNSEMSKTNSMIESGRFSIDVLNEDITHAGFWGGYVPLFESLAWTGAVTSGLPGATGTVAHTFGPCYAFSNWDAPGNALHKEYHDYLVGVPIEAYRDAAPTGCGAVVTDRKAGTDVLVVRHAETCLPGEANCEALDTNKVYFQFSSCDLELDATPPTRSVLTNGTANFVLHTRACGGSMPSSVTGTVAPIRKFVSNIYYVRTYSTVVGDGIPTLVRTSFGAVAGVPGFQAPQALIEGIEAFGIELGVDNKSRCGTDVDYTQPISAANNLTDPATLAGGCMPNANPQLNTLPKNRGDGVPDTWVRCAAAGCSVDQLRDTVAVKLSVLARSRDASVGHTDAKTYNLGYGTDTLTVTPAGDDQKFKRHAFQTTIRLVNVSGRRETP
jgi:type IV pilus assembly protein PilW